MQKTVFVFPGQGSQSVGMLAKLNQEFSLVKNIFDEASNTLNYDLWDLSQNGPEEKLNQTEFAQPILLTAGFAVWNVWLQQSTKKPDFLAGHSLGEYTALVCSEALDFRAALNLVRQRAKFMQDAVPLGKGAMVAIVGLDDKIVLDISTKAANETNQVLTPANYNSIGQIVLAGEKNAAEVAINLAKAAGAKIAKMLPMSVPSHCPLMHEAALKFADVLAATKINLPKIPVIQNADVIVFNDPTLIRDALVKQLYSPVRWVETIKYLAENGVKDILECGPGKVLTGLNKRIVTSDVNVDFIGDPDNLKKYR